MTAAGAGTTVRPIFGILGTASISPLLREVGIFNTTTTACTYRIVNFTGGTAGTGQTERKYRRNSPAASATTFGLWTADATVGEDCGPHGVLGAAAGSAMVWTFGDTGLEVELGATSGIGLVPIGTGQICEVYMVWDE